MFSVFLVILLIALYFCDPYVAVSVILASKDLVTQAVRLILTCPRWSSKCVTEQGLPSLLLVSESFACKELISQCAHLLFMLGLSGFNKLLNFILSS